jgi:hypothetical protein
MAYIVITRLQSVNLLKFNESSQIKIGYLADRKANMAARIESLIVLF